MSDAAQPTTQDPATMTNLTPQNSSAEVNKWIAIAESKKYTPDTFRRMNGSDIGKQKGLWQEFTLTQK